MVKTLEVTKVIFIDTHPLNGINDYIDQNGSKVGEQSSNTSLGFRVLPQHNLRI